MSCPRASAAPLVLAAALFALALPRAALRPPPCAHPRALDPGTGPTRRVACAAQPGGPPLRGPARLLFGLPIDPNRADPATLVLLPGIGPARAAAIVRERARRPFARVDDLRRVDGIGPVTLERLRPWLAPPAAAPGRVGDAAGAVLQQTR